MTAPLPFEYDRHLPSSLFPNHARHGGVALTSGAAVVIDA